MASLRQREVGSCQRGSLDNHARSRHMTLEGIRDQRHTPSNLRRMRHSKLGPNSLGDETAVLLLARQKTCRKVLVFVCEDDVQVVVESMRGLAQDLECERRSRLDGDGRSRCPQSPNPNRLNGQNHFD